MGNEYVEELVEMEDGDEILETVESVDVEDTSMDGPAVVEPITKKGSKVEAKRPSSMEDEFMRAINAPMYQTIPEGASVWGRRNERKVNTLMFIEAMNRLLDKYPEVSSIRLPLVLYVELADKLDIQMYKSPVQLVRGEPDEDFEFFMAAPAGNTK